MFLRWALALWLAAAPLHAAWEACERAALSAAAEHDVPADVLRAIALTETGRRMDGALRPWPWTVNLEGTGHWFDTRAEAETFAARALSEGRTSFDVGCFQINWRWHGEHFADLSTMFEPARNAAYAATYLSGHFEALGDWSRAAGRYHSGTPHYAQRYSARFERILANLDAAPPPQVPTAPEDEATGSASVFLLTRARGPLLTAARGPLLAR